MPPATPSLLSLLLVVASAQAAVIDVSQTSITREDDIGDFGQSFTPTATTQLLGIRLNIRTSSGGSDFVLRLHRYDPATQTLAAAVLASATVVENKLSSVATWIEILFPTPVSQVTGQSLAFTIDTLGPGGPAGWDNFGTTTDDVYAGGILFRGLSGQVTPFANPRELAFETIVRTVPEPAPLVLLGLAAPAWILRRARSREFTAGL